VIFKFVFLFPNNETLFNRFSVVTKGSSDTNSRSAIQSDLDIVEAHTRVMSFRASLTKRRMMPVTTGVEVEVNMKVRQSSFCLPQIYLTA
jgi:hypothetical protein